MDCVSLSNRAEHNAILFLSFPVASLIKYSAHLREIDLENNVLGEVAAADILEALRARKTGRVWSVCVSLHVSTPTHSYMLYVSQPALLISRNNCPKLCDDQEYCHRLATVVSFSPVTCRVPELL